MNLTGDFHPRADLILRPGHARTAPGYQRDLLILTFAFGALVFFCLGRAPLANPDESRYAEIPREMLASGDWVTPRLNGVNYFEKPPLVYWMIAGSMALFGANEWAIRAVPALAAIGGVLLTYAAVRRLYDRRSGLAAAGVLGLSLFYFILSRIVLLDMAVSVLISAALFCFILGIREPAGARRRGFFLGLYLAAALATLTKGLIGFLLPGAVMFLWLLLFAQWRALRPLYLPSGIALFLIVTVPWHVLAAQRNPEWARFYFVHEHWARFTSTVHGRVHPWWFFVPLVVLGLFPWLGFIGSALRDNIARTDNDPRAPRWSGAWALRRDHAVAGFFLLWAVFVWAFFSKSQSKLAPYVLPVFPPLAALLGAWIPRQLTTNPGRLRPGIVLFALTSAVLAGAVNLVTRRPELARLSAEQTDALRPFADTIGVIQLAGAAATLGLARLRRWRFALMSMAVTAVLFYGTLALATARIQPAGTRDIARFVRAALPLDAPIFHYGDFFHDFVFYAERFTGTVEFHGDEMELENDAAARASGRFIEEAEFGRLWRDRMPVYVVVRKKKLAALRNEYHQAWNEWKSADAANPSPTAIPRPQPPALADGSCRFQVLFETSDHLLISNLPPARPATTSD